jgi:hypothetical protein
MSHVVGVLLIQFHLSSLYPRRTRGTIVSVPLVGDECENGKGLGPIPPASEAIGEFQRFKNIYCNPDRVYQPDLVLDVKLYGKR